MFTYFELKDNLSEQKMQYNLVELMNNNPFGEFVFEKRKLAGLTQQQLADKAGISKSYVSTIENQRPHSVTGALSQPERKVVIAIAEALNVEVDEALNLAGYAPKPDAIKVLTHAVQYGKFFKCLFCNRTIPLSPNPYLGPDAYRDIDISRPFVSEYQSMTCYCGADVTFDYTFDGKVYPIFQKDDALVMGEDIS